MSVGRPTTGWRRGRHAAKYRFLVATPRETRALEDFREIERGSGLESLVAQDVAGRRSERLAPRVQELCRRFGIEWEPMADLGQMRLLPPGAFMFGRAREYAALRAREAANTLGLPFLEIEGVNVLDGSSAVMQRYAALVANEPGLYGTRPYQVSGDGGQRLSLRQTGCIQKFAVCRDWRLTARSLPLDVFEISESYRREPAETLQLCARLRRFHLPEAHLHTATLDDAVMLSLELHKILVREASLVGDDVQLFVSASNQFATRHRDYFNRLAATLGRPVLVKVYPPGVVCQDGVEVDVEYKILDSRGCTREFSTFQIDERITRVFGLSGGRGGGAAATIHAVCTSSVERYLFFQLDRIAAVEASGARAALPSWLTPVVARVIPRHESDTPSALVLGRELQSRGVRVDVDDRPIDANAKFDDAALELVPHHILVDAKPLYGDQQVEVRDLVSGAVQRQGLRPLVVALADAPARINGATPFGLEISRRPAFARRRGRR